MNELTKREFIATELMKALVSKYTLNKPEDQITLAELSIQLADTLLDKLSDAKTEEEREAIKKKLNKLTESLSEDGKRIYGIEIERILETTKYHNRRK